MSVTKQAQPKFTADQASALYEAAHQAGMAALSAATPEPIIVGKPSTPLGSDVDPSKRIYYVPEGLCGFAWIGSIPGTSSFGRWLLKTGRGRKSYEGGLMIWVRQGGQSIERKEAYAQAFAEVLREAGVRAFAGSRMD